VVHFKIKKRPTTTYIILHIRNIQTYQLLACGFVEELSFEVDLFGTLLLRFRENLEEKHIALMQ